MRTVSFALLLMACSGGGAPIDGGGAAGSAGAPPSSAGGSGGNAGNGGSMGDPDPDPEPELDEATLARLRELSPSELPPPPQDVSNAWADDAAAAAFGQQLFFDTRFAGPLLDGDNDGTEFALGHKGETGKVSCAGCHVPTAGFSDTRTLGKQISLGSGWGLRRSPSLLDVGQSKLLMWDGRHDSLYNQVFGPLESEVEMNSSRLFAAHQVFAHHKDTYEAIFGALPPLDDPERFPPLAAADSGCPGLDKDSKCTGVKRGSPGDGAEFDALSPADQVAVTRIWVNVGKALGAYQRLLTCGPGRFDAWMHGDESALSRAEQRGAALFVGKAGCVDCHSGPYLSDEKFHNVGLQPRTVAVVFIDADDPGASVGLARAKEDPLNVAGEFSDGDDARLPEALGDDLLGAFRTPRLRCVAERPTFMHTGHVSSLEEVVDFFSRGGDPFGYPGTNKLVPLSLNAREKADLVAFLKTLSGPGPAPDLLEPR